MTLAWSGEHIGGWRVGLGCGDVRQPTTSQPARLGRRGRVDRPATRAPENRRARGRLSTFS